MIRRRRHIILPPYGQVSEYRQEAVFDPALPRLLVP